MKDSHAPVRGAAFRMAALLLSALCAVTGAACWMGKPKDATAPADTPVKPAGQRGPFAGWDKPDFVLVLSGQQHGYLLPCGCSRPQYGGLERRYNLIQDLKRRGWDVVAADLGDIAQKEGPSGISNEQGLIKYRYSMEGLAKMGYAAVGVGSFEAVYPLNTAIDEYSLNNPKPAVIAANLLDRAKHFPAGGGKSYVGTWETVTTAKGVKVGIAGLASTHEPEKADDPPAVAKDITARNPALKFAGAKDVVDQVLVKEMDQAQVPFRVVLYQGPFDKARVLAQLVPSFTVILCLSDADVAPSVPTVENGGKSFVVRVGHKGKDVGVVGVWRTGKPDKPFEMRYELVHLGEEFLTPDNQAEKHEIVQLMERYTKELKDDQYLAKYHQNHHPLEAAAMQLLDAAKQPKYKDKPVRYVGSEACKSCHPHAYKVWKASPHSHAYQTLVDAKRPGNRQFDGECIACHVVGFRVKTGFQNDSSPSFLKAVGCENCHGPCSLHVEVEKAKEGGGEDLYPLINPWRAKPNETPKEKEQRLLKIETLCIKCHDQDNDVHWNFDKWEKKGIIHMTP